MSIKALGSFFISLVLLLTLGSTVVAEELPPDHAEFVSSIECVLDNLDQEDCAGREPERSCGFNRWETEQFEPTPYQDCAKELCKESSSANLGKNLSLVTNTTDSLIGPIRKKMGPQIKKLFAAYKKLGKSAKGQFESDPNLKDKAKAYQWLLSTMDSFRFNHSQATGEYLLPESWEKLKPQAKTIFFGWDQEMVKEFYTISKGLTDQFYLSDDYNKLNDKIFDEDARRLYLGKLERRVQALPDAYPDKLFLFQHIHKLQNANAINGGELSDIQYHQFVGLGQQLFMGEMLTSDPYSLMLAQKFKSDVDSFLGFTLYDEFVEGTEEDIFLSACEYAIANQASHLISKKEKKEIEGKIAVANQRMVARLKGMVSKGTQKALEKVMKVQKASLPPSREEYLDKMSSYLAEQAGMLNAVGESYLGSAPSYSEMNTIQLSEQSCALPFNLSGNGSELTTNGSHGDSYSITLGALTLHDFDRNGLWIYAHEVGHLASGVIESQGSKKSLKAYSASRKCIAKQKNQEGAAGRVEEDFADLFSFYFFPEIKHGPCTFLNDGQGWQGEENMIEDSPYNPKHSSTIYRLLHAHSYTGKELPKSCRDEIKKSFVKPNFKACWYAP